MKLEIDTEKDSRATLKGVLRMLQAILGEEGKAYSNRSMDRASQRNIFEDDSPSVSMYGDPVEEKPAPSSSSGGLFNMFGNPDTASSAMDSPAIEEEEPEDEPQIQIY